MKEIITKEHLLHFMQSGWMNLSTNDLKFVQNVLMVINKSNYITTNQVALFDRLVEKYKRQLDKHQLTVDKIKTLQWETTVKASEPRYTEAFIEIVDTEIHFKSPYNKNFLNFFRNLPNNNFKWNKELKRYEGKLNTSALRNIVNASARFYPVVNYCPITTKYLNGLMQYENVLIWNPTLINVNGNFMIAGCNQNIIEALDGINLNDEIHTLSKLAEYGVNIDESITKNDPRLEFISKFMPTVDYVSIDQIVNWLKELGCDAILLENLGINVIHRKSIRTLLTNIGVTVFESKIPKDVDISKFKYPVKLEFSTFKTTKEVQNFRKILKMTNSTPIELKI